LAGAVISREPVKIKPVCMRGEDKKNECSGYLGVSKVKDAVCDFKDG